MKENNGKSPVRFNIGGASIILILLVFAMTVFAILSIRASYYELGLARNSREAIQQYYMADSQAEEVYMEAMLLRGIDYDAVVSKVLSMDGVIGAGQSLGVLSYAVAVNDSSALHVKLDLVSGHIQSWKMMVEPMEGYSDQGFEVWEPIWQGSDTDIGDYSDLEEPSGSNALEDNDQEDEDNNQEDEDIDLGDYDDLDE